MCVSACTHVCVYSKYYYYYQHAIHLKAPSKLEPSRGAVGNYLPTRQQLVRRLAQKAASFGVLFACLVAFLSLEQALSHMWSEMQQTALFSFAFSKFLTRGAGGGHQFID